MQQIYSWALTEKCDLNKVALQLYLSQTFSLIFSCKFTAYFQKTYIRTHLETKTKIIQVTRLVLVSITLLWYTFKVMFTLDNFTLLFSLHFYWFSPYPRIKLLISIEKYIVWCLFGVKWLHFQRSCSKVYFIISSFLFLGANLPQNWLELLVQWWLVKTCNQKPVIYIC